jgi:DNA polymerase I-like protein with 3'-5' exonuclease and polymerase domains
LIDGARCRFNLWEPVTYGEFHSGLPHDQAEAKWPGQRLRRAGTNHGWNSLVQGSAARWTKRAMLGCWREGLLPLIQMHDELGHSVGDDATGRRVAEIMRDAVKLRVPSVTETMFGKSWGTVREGW